MSENPQQVDPEHDEIVEIVRKYDESAKVNDMGNMVRIISHNPQNTGPIVKELAEKHYSFDVDRCFELPTHIDVREKVNPDL